MVVKTIKQIAVCIIIVALLAAVSGCGREEGLQEIQPGQRRQVETVKPNEKDGQIYRNVEAFVNALVRDDREAVLSMLTRDHRNSWRDDSFLLNGQARERYEQFAVDNLNYTVVKYVNNEDTNFVETAFIIAVYDVVMKNGGQESGRVKIQESMAFRQEDGLWKMSVNERGFLVKAKQ